MPPVQAGALAPIAIVVPILAAALILIVGGRVPRAVVDVTALLVAAAATAITAVLAVQTTHGRAVTWAGGWQPRHGVSVGIVLVADPVGAMLACLAAALTCCALVYSWRYFEDVEAHYQALVLLFLAGMTGFALSGDLFNMFVFFELMGAVAYALTGLRVEEPDSVQGGFTFAVVNSLGAYLTLVGIGLLYARTGQLGLAQDGAALAPHPPDALVIAAFVLVNTGFLVKAAMVPLHFWLSDAHAVAPAPICVLMSGVMVELGVYAVARVHTVVFAAVIPPAVVEHAFVTLGVLSAAVGSVMCLQQRHLKRLLAYSTIAHVGLFLIAVGVGDADSLAGVLLYVLGHAGVKGCLFLVAGVLLNRFHSVDEGELFGRGDRRGPECWLFLIAGLALAGLPPFGPGLGKAVTEDAAKVAGLPWTQLVFVLVSAATGGAVLRAGARVFLGWGNPPRPAEPDQTSGGNEEPETEEDLSRTPAPMVVASAVLLALGLAVGVVPALARAAGRGADLFVDGPGYAAQALTGATVAAPEASAAVAWHVPGVLLGVLSTAIAVAVAGAGLRGVRLRRLTPLLGGLRRLHSGHVGDYVAWLFAGAAVLAALVGLPLV